MSVFNNLRLFTDAIDDMSTISTFSRGNTNQKFPHYNIKKLVPVVEDGNKVEYECYHLEVALAGYSKNDISITSEVKKYRNVEYRNITIAAEQQCEDGNDEYVTTYMNKGITTKPFQLTFVIMENDEIQGTTFSDGILRITIIRHFTTVNSTVETIEIK